MHVHVAARVCACARKTLTVSAWLIQVYSAVNFDFYCCPRRKCKSTSQFFLGRKVTCWLIPPKCDQFWPSRSKEQQGIPNNYPVNLCLSDNVVYHQYLLFLSLCSWYWCRERSVTNTIATLCLKSTSTGPRQRYTTILLLSLIVVFFQYRKKCCLSRRRRLCPSRPTDWPGTICYQLQAVDCMGLLLLSLYGNNDGC